MPIDRRAFRWDLEAKVRRGQHLIVYGPRGSGKSTLLHEIAARLTRERVPVGRAESTRCLGDITAALERAYPGVETTAVTRRAARTRLRAAADQCAGVLLLDHLTDVSTAMVGYLRRLRGGLVGVLMAVDVDAERDRERMRHWHVGISERMPAASARQLRSLLRSRFEMLCVTQIPSDIERHIIRSARGRPGWIEQCAQLAREPRYWRADKLFATLLCIDSEIALRGTIDLQFGSLPSRDDVQIRS